MNEIKINLDKLIEDFIVHDYIDELGDNMITCFKKYLKESYIEFGKQLLELTAENATYDWNDHEDIIIDKQSILDTIKQVE